jgi:hypothetical protein
VKAKKELTSHSKTDLHLSFHNTNNTLKFEPQAMPKSRESIPNKSVAIPKQGSSPMHSTLKQHRVMNLKPGPIMLGKLPFLKDMIYNFQAFTN